jgi:hypothetical protein
MNFDLDLLMTMMIGLMEEMPLHLTVCHLAVSNILLLNVIIPWGAGVVEL